MEHIVELKVRRGFETISPVFDIIQGRGFIGGSYAAFMVASHDTPILPNDVDIFTTSEEEASRLVADITSDLGMTWDYETEVASTLRPYRPSVFNMEIQVVRPHPEWKHFPLDIVSSFDMDICRAILLNDSTVLADVNAGDLEGKFLRINNPLRSLRRAMKYHARGVEFTDWELIKLFRAWEAFPPERRQELIEMNDPNNYEPDYNWIDDDDYFEGE